MNELCPFINSLYFKGGEFQNKVSKDIVENTHFMYSCTSRLSQGLFERGKSVISFG